MPALYMNIFLPLVSGEFQIFAIAIHPKINKLVAARPATGEKLIRMLFRIVPMRNICRKILLILVLGVKYKMNTANNDLNKGVIPELVSSSEFIYIAYLSTTKFDRMGKILSSTF